MRSDNRLAALATVLLVIGIIAYASYNAEPKHTTQHAGESRSPKWPKVREDWLAGNGHDECAVCKSKKDLQVHHLVPFHDKPELELDITNLVTLCGPKGRDCHLYWGHLGDFKCYNHNLKKWLKDVRDRKEE